MSSDEARADGYVEGLAGKPSYIAPVGLHNRSWLSGWMDGYIEREKRNRINVTQQSASRKAIGKICID